MRKKQFSLAETGRAMAINQQLAGKASESDIRRAMRLSAKNRESNPIEEGRADIVPWMLYDRQTTAANTATAVEYDFFTTPIGGTKYRQDTNMTQVMQLPNPQHFNCTSLQCFFSSRMTAIDIGTMFDTYYLEFWIGDKVYAQGPLSQFPGGAGINGVSTNTAQSAFSNGFPSPNAVVDFRMGDNPIGHHILQGQNFQVKVLTNAGYTTQAVTTIASAIGLNLLIVLEGVLSRSVQ
jgi:hypothetical protein